MFTMAGAELGPAKFPMARPRAQNGMAPAISAPPIASHCHTGMRTPPKAAPNPHSSATTMAPKLSAVTPLARKYAAGGMGLARFTCSQPRPRSTATPTPKANSVAPITPKAP